MELGISRTDTPSMSVGTCSTAMNMIAHISGLGCSTCKNCHVVMHMEGSSTIGIFGQPRDTKDYSGKESDA